jgi:hypothetical protein
MIDIIEIPHDGGIAYKIKICSDENVAYVYEVHHDVADLLINRIDFCKIFYSRSNDTIEKNGNSDGYVTSMLFQINPNVYVYVGSSINYFETEHEISNFKGPNYINSCVYSYATDDAHNYYLLVENVILHNPKISNIDDIYTYYYRITNMIHIEYSCLGLYSKCVKSDHITHEDINYISQLSVNNVCYPLTYSLTNNLFDALSNRGTIYVKRLDDTVSRFNIEEYTDIMNRFAKKFNISALHYIIDATSM